MSDLMARIKAWREGRGPSWGEGGIESPLGLLCEAEDALIEKDKEIARLTEAQPSGQALVERLRAGTECDSSAGLPTCRANWPRDPASWCDGCVQLAAADALSTAASPAPFDKEGHELLAELRINANRLCDRMQGGTYEADCRRTLKKVDNYQSRAYRAGLGKQLAVTPAATQKLRKAFDEMLIAEVHRFGGIPHLQPVEVWFREVLAEFLEGEHNKE